VNRSQLPNKLTAAHADVQRIRHTLLELDGFVESITLWVPGAAFGAWARAIEANVMHTMRGKSGDGFAWCTSDNSGMDTRVVVHTHDTPAPWVQFPPHGAEDTKRYKLFIEMERN
jgi:hypothetical protein